MRRPVPSTETKRSIRPLRPFVEEVLHAAQIAESLLADVADEGDAAGRLHVRRRSAPAPPRAARRAPRQSSPMPGPRMTVPSRVTLTSVPSGNTVSRCAARDEMRAGGAAGTLAEHVAHRVDAHVLQPELAELAGVELGALLLLERRRLDLADFDLLGQRPGLVGLGRCQARLDRRVDDQLGAELGPAPAGRPPQLRRRRRGGSTRQRACAWRRHSTRADTGLWTGAAGVRPFPRPSPPRVRTSRIRKGGSRLECAGRPPDPRQSAAGFPPDSRDSQGCSPGIRAEPRWHFVCSS